jgi:hypothetical protein
VRRVRGVPGLIAWWFPSAAGRFNVNLPSVWPSARNYRSGWRYAEGIRRLHPCRHRKVGRGSCHTRLREMSADQGLA